MSTQIARLFLGSALVLSLMACAQHPDPTFGPLSTYMRDHP